MKPRICLLMIIGLLACIHQAAAQNFTLASSPVVGLNPSSVVALDINGDGKLDLICLSGGYQSGSFGTVTVLTNNGNGRFGSNLTYTVPIQHFSTVAADVNGDGKPDLICTSGAIAPTFTVLTNNGNGGFGSNATYTAGYVSFSVTAADVNGDGKVDLITANAGVFDSLTVLTNNGSGSFASNATYSVGASSAYWVIAADVNGDGQMDLISANDGNPGSLTVLTNNGSGVFGFNGNYTVGVAPQCVTAADVNGDGKVDLISANFSGNSLTVLTNDGSGGFVLASTLNVGISPISVVAADVNGDGKLDLISANEGVNGNGGTLTVLTNNGNGSFVLASTFNAISPHSIVAADVNGDGKLDFICANGSGTYSDALSVFTNNIAFPPPASTPPLNINFQSNRLIVTWPSESAGWSLQQSPDLTTHWGPSGYSGYTISDDGINKSLFIPSQPGNLFFRLMHP